MPGPLARGRPTRIHLALAGIAALTVALSFAVGGWLFPHLSANNDEGVYVLEARVLEGGHLTLPADEATGSFRPWMSGRHGDRVVLVEQPVLPALMAVSDRLLGTMRAAIALVAAGTVLAVFVLTRELLEDDAVALAAAGCFALSPFAIVQSALYLSYTLAVGLAALALALLLRSLRTGSRRALLGSGLAAGVLFFARPLESLVLGAVVLLWLAIDRTRRPVLRRAGWLALGAVGPVAACLAYNAATTGSPVRFPLWVIGGNDSFGFGDRSIADGAPAIHVGVAEEWLALRANLRALPHWLLGGLVALPAIGAGAVLLWRRHRPAFWLLAGIAVLVPVAYFFYWGSYLVMGGRNLIGPHYYMALLLPTSIASAVAVVELLRRVSGAAIAPVVAGFVVAVVAGTGIELPAKVDRNTGYRDAIAREVAAVRAIATPALVIVPSSADGPYVLHPRAALGNPPELRGPRLFAADRGGENLALFDRFPDRRLYRLQPRNDGFTVQPDVAPLERLRGAALELSLAVRDGSATALRVSVDGADVSCPVAGLSTLTVTVTAEAATLHGCATPIAAPLPDHPVTLTMGVVLSTATGAPATAEVRYWVGSDGGAVTVASPGDVWSGEGSTAAPATNAAARIEPRVAVVPPAP